MKRRAFFAALLALPAAAKASVSPPWTVGRRLAANAERASRADILYGMPPASSWIDRDIARMWAKEMSGKFTDREYDTVLLPNGDTIRVRRPQRFEPQ